MEANAWQFVVCERVGVARCQGFGYPCPPSCLRWCLVSQRARSCCRFESSRDVGVIYLSTPRARPSTTPVPTALVRCYLLYLSISLSLSLSISFSGYLLSPLLCVCILVSAAPSTCSGGIPGVQDGSVCCLEACGRYACPYDVFCLLVGERRLAVSALMCANRSLSLP